MSSKKKNTLSMRILHRYLGFFLVGIMAVYAVSGIVLIFRNTNTFKKADHIEKTVEANFSAQALGQSLRIRNLKVDREEGDIMYFEQGTYNKKTGVADYTVYELPFILDKITHLHKASTRDSLYWLNIFFGLSLLFFVVSTFWMFLPKTKTFRKGLYFTAAGIIFTLIILFV